MLLVYTVKFRALRNILRNFLTITILYAKYKAYQIKCLILHWKRLNSTLPVALALIQHFHLPEYTTATVSRSLLYDLQNKRGEEMIKGGNVKI